MSSEDPSKKSSRPQLVKLDQAFKLAEKWVSNMTQTKEGGSTRVVLEARPPGLGIGAAVPRQSKVLLSNDPVERKLRAKLDAGKRKFANIAEKTALSAGDESIDDSSDDEESESRATVFVKKKSTGVTSSLPAKKK